MARVDTTQVPVRPYHHGPLVRGVVWVAILALGGVIVVEGWALYREFADLLGDRAGSRGNAVIGYQNIHPKPDFAAVPDDWIHDEGEHTVLWAGWREDKHSWFRIGRGDLTRGQVTQPFGSDVIQAIDYPIVEEGDGSCWRNIPGEAHVVGIEIKGVHTVYPLLVLQKVEVVNDAVQDIPLLVLYTPFQRPDRSVGVYDPTLGGRRVTLASSGYFLDKKPLLYDRATRSLWGEREDAIVAVAGPSKGASLPRLGRPEIIAWSDWRYRHPKSRLIVGADRTRGKPNL